MSKPKYLYIDDESGASETSTLNMFNDLGVVEVSLFPLGEFKDFGKLRNELISLRKKKAFDGVIIDLRLDGDGANRVDFNATSIAQELRSMTARGDAPAFPIILCSTETKIRETYDADKSSHDLFDYKFEKSANPDSKKFSRKLDSLAKGYELLNASELKPVMIFKDIELSSIDPRIMERFDASNKLVVHDYAHFAIKNLFHCTNPLLKERTVAARLGIDIEASPEWRKLLECVFSQAKYSGVFSDGWDRWWANSITDAFKTMTGKKLTFLKAEERVGLLIEKTGIQKLAPAKPIKHCKSTEFWTICEGYKTPLDPIEGFKIYSSSELKPWQESKYLSLDAVLERIGVEKGLRPHPSEKARIDALEKAL